MMMINNDYNGAARRRMTSSKMKRMKQSGCKDQDELEEDNEELFAELGIAFSCLAQVAIVIYSLFIYLSIYCA